MTPDPTPSKMAEHLKELGPQRVAEALCAANAAMAPLCKHHADPATPPDAAPKNVADIASQMRGGGNEKGGSAWT